MNDRPPRVRVPGPRRILVGPLSLALALTASACSPDTAPSPGADGTTSKVPEIAKRQKHMADLLKKGETKAEPPAKPR